MKKYIYVFISILLIGCSSTDDTAIIPDNNDPDDDDPINTSITIITLDASQISATKVITGGEILDDGGNAITARGIVWGTTENPSLDDSITIDGIGDGVFESSLMCLDPNTTFYVRAYATNTEGTAYGDEIIFATLNHKIFTGDVILTSQQEIDNFGTHEYSKIIGSLVIKESSPNFIDNIKTLECLKIITGGLSIEGNVGLENLEGLDCLENVEGGISISENNKLINLMELNNITGQFGGLQITSNNSLTSLSGLENLTSGRHIYIAGNSLTSLEGLNNIQSLIINNNQSNNGNGGLNILYENSLTNIDALINLTVVGNNGLLIQNCNSLININGLGNLTPIGLPSGIGGNGLYIRNCNSLTNIEGLNNLTFTGGINIHNCPSLITVDALNNITTLIPSGLQITNCQSLINLDG